MVGGNSRTCPSCFGRVPAGVARCPSCGSSLTDSPTGREFEFAVSRIVANETVEVEVIRGRELVMLSLVRRCTGKLGYDYGEVPILEGAP